MNPVSFHPVMDYTAPLPAIDLTSGYNHSPDAPQLFGAGGYMEFRRNMYTSPLFAGKRFVHMGVDIWGEAGAPVYAFADGVVWGFRNNANQLDYGPTIVTRHTFGDKELFALYGHLCLSSLDGLQEGMKISSGQQIATLGDRHENGGWVPHLHFQLSTSEPEAPDMPGVVAPEDLEQAVRLYPDPRMVLGPLYL